jgi:hypothetical protein
VSVEHAQPEVVVLGVLEVHEELSELGLVGRVGLPKELEHLGLDVKGQLKVVRVWCARTSPPHPSHSAIITITPTTTTHARTHKTNPAPWRQGVSWTMMVMVMMMVRRT